ncbi:MAG TPA: glutathione S-transferase [Rhodobacteraceae bacterium]|nr:glutathione S-transferase [Paracoccaceae bacterium]
MSNGLNIVDAINKTCPWSGKPVAADSLLLYRGKVVGFCNQNCRDKFARAIELFDPLIDKKING